jgi:hypothetical protein
MQMASRAMRLVLLGLAAWLFGGAGSAGAQDLPDDILPIGRFAVDARAAFPKMKQDAVTAAGIGVTPANLPTRELGLVFGAHFYPARIGIVTFGVGGEMIFSRRSHTLNTGTKDAPMDVTVNSRFSSLSPQVSLNFGKRDGWSYVSAGMGSSTFTAERSGAPLPDPVSRSKTLNYGGGARWFTKKHLAVSVDLRFYAVNPETATTARPARSRMTIMTLSGGVALK